MASARSDACLLVSAEGSLAGIVTDNDMTRRVVAKGIDPEATVDAVMTSNPKCVHMDDSAMEALGVMVERHFRHLPVTGKDGTVTGLLDIAKCLYDAISRMERVAKKSTDDGDGSAAQMAAMAQAMATGGRRGMSAAQAAAMKAMMDKMFGGDGIQTLDDVLASKGRAIFVRPGDSVRSAAEAMADCRKAVLVVERGVLVGIFTPKDMLNRVLAKNLSPDETMVSDVMTPNPDSVLPELTVLDALHQMHECRYLHLPVVTDGGRVVGLVDVMEIINATVGKEG
ncbi:unnamed protein product, partial [Chrysoparadoxa australica]